MPTPLSPPPDDDDIAAVLAEVPPPPSEEAIQAALSDPTFAGVVARATRRLPGILTPKAVEQTRRTLAVLFLTNPHAASLLADTREAEASLAQLKAGAEPAPAGKKKSKP
jgi:hypothetical protein